MLDLRRRLIHLYTVFAFPCVRNLRDPLGREGGRGNKKEVGMKGELMPVVYYFGCSLLFSPSPSVTPGYEMSLSHLYSNVKVQVMCDEKRFYPINYQPAKILPFGCSGQD